MSQIKEKHMEGYKETELGLLPESWELKQISDLVEKTKQKDMRKTDFEFKYIDVSSVDRDLLRIIDYKKYLGKKAPSRARKIVKKNDIIFATVRPTLKRIALIGNEFDNQICSTAFCVLRAKYHDVDYRFLYYAIQQKEFIDTLGKIQRGASYPAVTDSDIKNQKIFVPPLPEQQKISYVLSTIQEVKEKTENVIISLQELKKSMMKHLFTYGPISLKEAKNVPLIETEIGLIPESWNVKSLHHVSKIIMGQSPPGKTYNTNGKGMPFLQGKSEFKNIYPKHNRFTIKPLKIAPKHSVLISVRAPVGDVNIANIDFCIGRGLASISLHKGNNKFLFYFLTLNRKHLEKEGTGSTFKAINKSKLKKFKIPFPSIEIQKQISNILANIDEKIESEQKQLFALDDLFKSTLHNLMTAKIRVYELEV